MENGVILRNKTLILGNAAVGKTLLVSSFHNNQQLPPNYSMTLHSEISIKAVNIPDTNVTVELYVHDIGGNDVFQEYAPKYVESFKSLSKWLAILKHIKTLKHCKGILVATKIDQTHRRAVSKAEGEEFARQNSLAYFETSVADGIDVDAPFYYAAYSFYERFEAQVKATIKSVEL
ncbi:Intraflagellar transport protein 27, partial [Boothiomyces macroporosus]